MWKALLRWVIGIISVLIAIQLAKLIGLKMQWPDAWRIAIFVPVLALMNSIVAPVLRFFSAPITCLTLGLFGFVINALMFWAAGAATGAEMSFLAALFGSIVYTVISAPLSALIKRRER